MGITILTADPKHDFDDARALIERLEERYGQRLRDKLKTARDLLTEVENEAADQGHPL